MAPKPRVHVGAGDLRALVTGIFAAAGMSPEHAAATAEPFVWANLRGVDSHGVSRVPRYLELFASGEANPAPSIDVRRVRPAALLVDADRAPGPLALTEAMRAAIETARETGVAWAVVRATTLAGAIGYFTSLAAAEGMVGIGIVAGMPNMGYEGARGAAVATSPLSIAIPATRHADLVLDMATAGIALGKIAQYRLRGEQLPPGMATTAEGEPTTDPSLAKVPLPLGGAKGSGMSLAFELLASGLAGNPIVPAYHGGAPEGRRHRQNAIVVAVDVAAFLDPGEYAGGVDETIDAIKRLPAVEGAEVLYPGERGARTQEQRERDGIPLAPKTWAELSEAAAGLGVAVPEVEQAA
ncbi:MAG TPA: Ldh family oxidoreductase [Solirubrobacteraceae bacterium]|nr:Ldh family oxidoreductase [Solirubrobacteraceae bacterium]